MPRADRREPDLVYLTPITTRRAVAWDQAAAVSFTHGGPDHRSRGRCGLRELPAPPGRRRATTVEQDFASWLLQSKTIDLLRHPSLKVVSKPGESERDFRVRYKNRRARIGSASETLRQKYAPKVAALQGAAPRGTGSSARERAARRRAFSRDLGRRHDPGACLGRKSITRLHHRPATTAAPRRALLKETRTWAAPGDGGRGGRAIAASTPVQGRGRAPRARPIR